MSMMTGGVREVNVSGGEQTQDKAILYSEEYAARAMPHVLGSVDMTALYLVAIFFVVNAVTAAGGGAAAFTYLLLGAVTFFVPCAIATAQLGAMFPHEGSLYNWTHKALGGYWSFFIGFCAWFPGVLVIVAGADIVMGFIQGLNGNWLVEPWQQGLVIITIIVVTGFISMQRMQMVQYFVNAVVGLTLLGVVIVGLAGLAWLASGHKMVTDLSINWTGWGLNSRNIGLFGLITLAYLGTEVPLNMGGEMKGNTTRVVKNHLLWGTVLALIGYFIATFSVLTVLGPNATQIGGFAVITTVDTALGKFAGGIAAICFMAFFFAVPIVYNNSFARLLLVGGIDRRLPMNVAKLSRNRIPTRAIFFQSTIAVIFTLLAFMVVPYVIHLGGKPSDLSTEVYNVSQATATLVWAISTAFFFIDMLIFYRRDRGTFRRHLLLPMPILWVCSIVGPLACLLAIIDTLFFSWIPQVPNGQWGYIVGGITVVCLVIAAIGSMLASSEAAWQDMRQE